MCPHIQSHLLSNTIDTVQSGPHFTATHQIENVHKQKGDLLALKIHWRGTQSLQECQNSNLHFDVFASG